MQTSRCNFANKQKTSYSPNFNDISALKSWTRLVQATFHQSETRPSSNETVHRRDLTSDPQTRSISNTLSTPSPVAPQMVLHVRISCESNFYGPDCSQFCQPMRGPHGNFICEHETGIQKCLPGWSGQRCTEGLCSKHRFIRSFFFS